MEVTMVCEEIREEIIVRLPTSAYEKSSKRRKKSASIARPVSTYGDDRHGKYLPKPTRRNVIKDDHYSYQKMRIDHARNRKPLTLRRSLRLSQKIENQECLPECAPGIVTENISGRIQFDSTYDRIDAADDKIISIMDLPHYHSDECEAMVEVLALERQQRDDMPQMKIIPCLEAAEEDRLDCDSSSISTTYNNEHTPKATNNDTGNIPVQSHDRLDATSESNKTVAILDNGPQHKLPISSLTTTEMTSLPWIECFRSDELMGQKREHDIQARPSGVSLTELHQLSLPPWFPYRRA